MERERTTSGHDAYATTPPSSTAPSVVTTDTPVSPEPRSSAPPLSNNSTTDSSSLGTLFSELSTDLSTLVRQEIELARTETTEKVSTAARSAGALVAGGLIAYAGVIVVLIAVAILLGEIMPLWLAMLIVGLVVLVIGAIMAISGKNKLANLNVVPEKTVETLKEDARWAKEQVS
jgi:hypothetical protein